MLENNVQKRIQLGVAKKIMNGARKIVLDKAEEARAAAFSAFKALGVDVPQFSLPKLPSASVNLTKKEPVTSSREDTTSSFVGVDQKDINSNTNVLIEEKPSDVGLVTSAEENSNDTTLSNTRADTTVMKQNNLDENVKPSEKEHEKENICVGNKDRNSEKGPTSAVNVPGGFDSFLDMWETTQDFFFDIHFNKRSEFHTIAPFELHGIAICWEDSPVYYISIPKDLFWSDNKIIKTPSGNSNLEVAKQRWARIGMIMGKCQVRKFGWNLKIQNQVLKHPAVSIQRFGSATRPVKSIGVELIENSYYMFSPIQLKDVVDLCVVVWILWPDDERSSNPNLEKVRLGYFNLIFNGFFFQSQMGHIKH